MDFSFDLNFLNDYNPNTSETDSGIDARQLAAKIAETDALVHKIQFLEAENKKSDKSIIGLNNSIQQIKTLYDLERGKAGRHAADNEKLRDEIISFKAILNQKQGELEQLALLHEQSAEEYKLNIEKDQNKYNSLGVQFINQAKILLEHNLLDGKAKKEVNDLRKQLIENNVTVPSLKSSKKKQNISLNKEIRKNDIGIGCNLMPCFEEVKKETVTRGTQYVTSTTTRAACTSAFIKKRTIGTNFPEPVSVTVEKALMDMIFDLPEPISPIGDIFPIFRENGTQTEISGQKSTGTCTKIKNIRRKLKLYKRFAPFHTGILPENIKKESPMGSTSNLNDTSSTLGDTKIGNTLLQPTNPLIDLWNLLGQTIFALIRSGNSSLSPSQIKVVCDRMYVFNYHLQIEMTNRLCTDQNFIQRNYFESLMKSSKLAQISRSSSADSFSMDYDYSSDNYDSSSESCDSDNKTTNTKDAAQKRTNEITNTFKNIFENTFTKNLVYSIGSDNFNKISTDNNNKLSNITGAGGDTNDNFKQTFEISKPCQVNQNFEEENLNEIENNCIQPMDISNSTSSSRKSVIIRTENFETEKTPIILEDINKSNNFPEGCDLNAGKNTPVKSLPDAEEFLITLKSGKDLDRLLENDLEEIEMDVESFCVENYNNVDNSTSVEVVPNKCDLEKNLLHSAEVLSTENDCRSDQGDVDNENTSLSNETENITLRKNKSEEYDQSNSKLTEIEKCKDAFLDDFDMEYNADNKISEKSKCDPNMKDVDYTAVDEILEMFSKLPSSQQSKTKIKRLKCKRKLSKRKLGLRKKVLMKKNGKNCFFPVRNYKDRDKPVAESKSDMSEMDLKHKCDNHKHTNVLAESSSNVLDCNSKSLEEEDRCSVQSITVSEDELIYDNSTREPEDEIFTEKTNLCSQSIDFKIAESDMKTWEVFQKFNRIEQSMQRRKDDEFRKSVNNENNTQIIYQMETKKKSNIQTNLTDEEISPSSRPSTPNSGDIDRILEEYISNIIPISRISDSDSDNERSCTEFRIRHNVPKDSENYNFIHESNRDTFFECENLSNDNWLEVPDDENLLQDSPQSPHPYELECLTDCSIPKLIPLERSIENDVNYSPLSPLHVTNFEDDTCAPVIIPTNRKFGKITKKTCKNHTKLKSIFGRIIEKFNGVKQIALMRDKIRQESAVESKLIVKTRQIIEHYVLSNAETAEVIKCILRLFKRTECSNTICKSIMEVIEDTDDDVCNKQTPPLPAMTETHKKIIVLINKINVQIKGFSYNLIQMVEQRLFNLKPEKIPLQTILNLTILFIALIDLQDGEKNSARNFIYKCLYYHNKNALPMIYYVLMAYPAVLPKKSDPYYDRSDAIISSIQCILNSLVYSMENKDFKHREVFHILALYYEYDRVKPSREELIENLIAKIKAGKFQNVSYAFALVCKHNGIEWTEKEVIVKYLLPVLTEYYNMVLQSDAHDMSAALLLESLSIVLKPFPLDYNVSRYLQVFKSFLHATDRKIVQEAALCAVLRIQRFGIVDCFNIICNWNPNYEIDSNLRIMLKSFLYRKPLKFWRKLENQI